jgi:hypothetical protein
VDENIKITDAEKADVSVNCIFHFQLVLIYPNWFACSNFSKNELALFFLTFYVNWCDSYFSNPPKQVAQISVGLILYFCSSLCVHFEFIIPKYESLLVHTKTFIRLFTSKKKLLKAHCLWLNSICSIWTQPFLGIIKKYNRNILVTYISIMLCTHHYVEINFSYRWCMIKILFYAEFQTYYVIQFLFTKKI